MVLHPALLGDPEPRTPQTFFEKTCPAVLELRHEACRALGGSVAFVLGPAKAWTVDFGGVVVTEGASEDADLRFEIDPEDFVGVLKGHLRLIEIYQAGRLRLAGNHQMLERMSILFGA